VLSAVAYCRCVNVVGLQAGHSSVTSSVAVKPLMLLIHSVASTVFHRLLTCSCFL